MSKMSNTWSRAVLGLKSPGRLAEIDGFVLFDPTNRYKVDFPNGWPESTKREKETQTSKAVKNKVKAVK